MWLEKSICFFTSLCYHQGNLDMEVFPMAYVIGEGCISCGSCASVCPAEAIAMGESHYAIDQDKCLSCGTCADTCPMEAISQE